MTASAAAIEANTRHLIRAMLAQGAAQYTAACVAAGRKHPKEDRPMHSGDIAVIAHQLEKWVFEIPPSEGDSE